MTAPLTAAELATYCAQASQPDSAMLVVNALSQVLHQHGTITYPSLMLGVATLLAEVAEDSPRPDLCGPALAVIIARAQAGLALYRQPPAGQA